MAISASVSTLPVKAGLPGEEDIGEGATLGSIGREVDIGWLQFAISQKVRVNLHTNPIQGWLVWINTHQSGE
jgi:hypothetical protein